jgi:hypothetical protein
VVITAGIALFAAGAVLAAVVWWPAGRNPDTVLSRPDVASVTSVLLALAGVVVAFLAWRHPVAPRVPKTAQRATAIGSDITVLRATLFYVKHVTW